MPKQEQPQFNRPTRPTTRGAAIAIVQDIYRQNDWDADAQKRFEASLALEDKQLTERTNEEIKVLIDDFEKSKMLIFSN